MLLVSVPWPSFLSGRSLIVRWKKSVKVITSKVNALEHPCRCAPTRYPQGVSGTFASWVLGPADRGGLPQSSRFMTSGNSGARFPIAAYLAAQRANVSIALKVIG